MELEQPICEHYRRAAEIIGRRWVPELIRVLLDGPTRYGVIRTAIPGISDHLLSERLKSLEADAIVIRTVLPHTPVRVEYTLTEKGADLAAAIEALASWAERWTGATAPA
jgi:DNA-binding HxlR family transcriptional regulator